MLVEQIVSWKVTITLREDEGAETILYFANEGLARLAVEWAYTVQLARVLARQDLVPGSIQEYPNLHDGSWKMRNLLGKKLAWARKTVPESNLCFPVKDYFVAEKEECVRHIID